MNDNIAKLARALSFGHGIMVYPKGDGRIEIPHNIVKFMGWKDKSVLKIEHGDGFVKVSNGNIHHLYTNTIGKVSVSADRVRIPYSTLKKASIHNIPIFIIINDKYITVLPRIVENDVEKILRDLGEEVCERLRSVLFGAKIEKIEPNITEVKIDTVEKYIQEPKLFLPTTSTSVVRVIGGPFVFQSHWVWTCLSRGALIPHLPNCSLCAHRAPDKMYLIPILKTVNEKVETGFLLVQQDLRDKIAKAIIGKDSTKFDIILFYKSYIEGCCDVYTNPVEPISNNLLTNAQKLCNNPDSFIASSFPDETTVKDLIPSRMPIYLVAGHFTDETKPKNLK